MDSEKSLSYNVVMIKADLHLHSTYSDGSDTVKELVENIQKAGIKVFALTDHDTNEGCIEITKYIPDNVHFIPGIELTCLADSVKCHILGYNCDPTNSVLKDLILKGKILRRNKLEKRIEHLKNVWNIELSKDELDWLYSRNSVVKIHIANILVNRGLAPNNIDAMKKYLDACKTGNSRFDAKDGIFAIEAAGGIPVWAHPLGGEGEVHLTPEEFVPKLEIMLKFGIKGLECYYSRYSMKEIEYLVGIAKKYNLFITGGSDYHGKNKDVILGCLNTDNAEVASSLLTLLDSLTDAKIS